MRGSGCAAVAVLGLPRARVGEARGRADWAPARRRWAAGRGAGGVAAWGGRGAGAAVWGEHGQRSPELTRPWRGVEPARGERGRSSRGRRGDF